MSEQITQIIAYGIPVIALIISIFTYYAAVRERHNKSAAEQAEIGVKLDTTIKTLDEIKGTVDILRAGYSSHETTITKLETKVTGLEGRVKRVEANLKELETKVHDFHTTH